MIDLFWGSPYLSDSQIFLVTVKPFRKVFYFCDDYKTILFQ